MSGSDPLAGAGVDAAADVDAGRDVFVLTDEQIIGLEPEAQVDADANDSGAAGGNVNAPGATKRDTQTQPTTTHAGAVATQEAPGWLQERMKDPWHGDEARELWQGVQQLQREAAAYREVFAKPQDARALKELYPGGVNEAKVAAESARQLAEIDSAFYRGDAAARAQLAQRLMQQDPAAFREMVAAGVRLLEAGTKVASESVGRSDTTRSLNPGTHEEDRQDAVIQARSLQSEPQTARLSGRDESGKVAPSAAEGGIDVATAKAYASFEKAANAEVERSVGSAIERTLEQALGSMSMRRTPPSGGGPSLPERLGNAVREEIDAALKSDGQLGEQIARVLAGRRFDDGARAQVVRLIDARAQQLVPGAVRRVVGSWTQAALAARRGKADGAVAPGVDTQAAKTPNSAAANTQGKVANRTQSTPKNERRNTTRSARVDYGKLSDEEIVNL